MGLEVCRCQVCAWNGMREDLLGVASDGLTLEDKVSKLAEDTLQFFHAKMGNELAFFLARWGVVDPEDDEQMRMVTARVVGRMASGVMQYCMGDDDEAVSPEVVELDDFVERVGVGIADHLLRLGVVDPKAPDLSAQVDTVLNDVRDCVVARCTVVDDAKESRDGNPEGS